MIKPEKQKEWTALLLILTFSLFLKGLLLCFHGSDTINTDGVIYVSAAQAILAGNWELALSIYPMPAYPSLIALIHFLVPDWTWAGRVLSALLLTFAIIPLFFMTAKLYGTRAALFAGLAAAAWPTGNTMALYIYRDPCFVLVGAISIYWFLKGVSNSSLKAICFAFSAAWLSLLFRVEGIILPITQLTYLVVVTLRSKLARLDTNDHGLVFAGFSISFAAIFLFLLAMKTEHLEINRISEYVQLIEKIVKGELFTNLENIHAQLKIMEQYSPFPQGGLNFAEIARHYGYFIYFMGAAHAFLKALFLPYAAGAVYGAKDNLKNHRLFLIFFAFIFFIMAYFFLLERDFLEERFLLLPAFALLPLTGAGLAKGVERGVMMDKKHPWFLISIAVILLALLADIKAVAEPPDILVKRAGQWLSNNHRNQRIVTNDIRIAYEAGHNIFSPESKAIYWDKPVGQWNAVEAFARQQQADIIAIKINKKKMVGMPVFTTYARYKEFSDARRAVIVFTTKNRNL